MIAGTLHGRRPWQPLLESSLSHCQKDGVTARCRRFAWNRRELSLTECQRRCRRQATSRGIRHFIVQCAPERKNAISVLPSNGLSAEFNSLVPKPASPTVSIGGPSVSSQTIVTRSSLTAQDTCSIPLAEENAPYL